MSLKRTIDNGSSPNRPVKRRHLSLPHTPHTPYASAAASIFATPRTPHTPYPLYPSDSPTNPFGRKGALQLIRTLPPPTSFSKHLALRFQLVRRGVTGPRQGGVHRIVQVPLSYSFTHFRCLISFLFGGGLCGTEEDEHLFEIKKEIATYSPLYKPGEIKKGVTWAKLSSVRDPCRYNPQYDLDGLDEDEIEIENGEMKMEDSEEKEAEESEGWEWVEEEDFTLSQAWPDGVDAKRGIIYHHSRTTQVHITLNDVPVPRRIGVSNVPHIFRARGRVHLSPPPLPRPIFSAPTKNPSPAIPKRALRSFMKSSAKAKPEQELTDADADGDTDLEPDSCVAFDADHPFHAQRKDEEDEDEQDLGSQDSDGNEDDDSEADEDEERDDSEEDDGSEGEESDQEEDPNAELRVKKWNKKNAFALYLVRYTSPLISSSHFFSDEEDENDENENEPSRDFTCTPGLTEHSSSSAPSSPMLSSPSSLPADHYQYDAYDTSTEFMIPTYSSYPKYTPAPPKAQRIRIARMEKRIERSKKGGYLCAKDEVPDEDGVDELLEEDEEEEEGEGERYVKPVLKEGEIWDPFGDELEV